MSREYKSVSDSMSEGGPAFPGKVLNTSFAGITTRDYFAAKAMQVLLTKESLQGYGIVCEHAYLVADRMLEARK